MSTSGQWPARTAAPKTSTFAMKPAVGGMPASDSRKSVISAASPGLLRASPAYEESEVPRSPRPETSITTPNAPSTITA